MFSDNEGPPVSWKQVRKKVGHREAQILPLSPPISLLFPLKLSLCPALLPSEMSEPVL